MNTSLCAAISGRRVIHFSYDGGARTAEPHTHGVSTAGHEVLCGYQTAGVSQSGEPVGWKLFLVSKMSGISDAGRTFSSNRPGYNPNDSRMTSVHCHV